jgi:hypothetical protein
MLVIREQLKNIGSDILMEMTMNSMVLWVKLCVVWRRPDISEEHITSNFLDGLATFSFCSVYLAICVFVFRHCATCSEKHCFQEMQASLSPHYQVSSSHSS